MGKYRPSMHTPASLAWHSTPGSPRGGTPRLLGSQHHSLECRAYLIFDSLTCVDFFSQSKESCSQEGCQEGCPQEGRQEGQEARQEGRQEDRCQEGQEVNTLDTRFPKHESSVNEHPMFFVSLKLKLTPSSYFHSTRFLFFLPNHLHVS